MDFFEHQDVARRKTGLLITYFGLAVLMIIISVYLAFVVALLGAGGMAEGEFDPGSLWKPEIFLYVAGGTAAIVLIGSLFKIAALRGGGEAVALELGGRRIDPNTTNGDERRVLNVVEEMALASGVPVPPVFMIEEPGINAFAAGFESSDAVIGVTRGCVNELTRDQLQGVMAHEFSHILNGDMRMNIRLIGVLNGIVIIGVLGYWIFRSTLHSGSRRRSRNSKDSGNTLPIVVFGLIVMAIGYIGVLFGKLIKSAVSRQREYLADASAVQFTRDPAGISGALKRIGGLDAGSRIQHKNAEELSHMFFANGLGNAFLNAMATHPPLHDRIARIDPQFDGTMETRAARGEADGRASGFAGAAAEEPVTVQPEQIMESVGAPAAEHVERARSMHAALPQALLDAAHEPFGSRALVYGLLLSSEASVRATQMERLESMADAAVLDELRRLEPEIRALPSTLRIPLIDIAIPALRMLSPGQYHSFSGNLTFLKEADAAIDLFEYCVGRMLSRHLEPAFSRRSSGGRRLSDLSEAVPHAQLLVSSLSQYGADDANEATAAFAAGASQFPPGTLGELLPADACTLTAVDDALSAMARAVPGLRKVTLAACAASVACDGEVVPVEAELLRAIADGMDCPLPPVLSHSA